MSTWPSICQIYETFHKKITRKDVRNHEICRTSDSSWPYQTRSNASNCFRISATDISYSETTNLRVVPLIQKPRRLTSSKRSSLWSTLQRKSLNGSKRWSSHHHRNRHGQV